MVYARSLRSAFVQGIVRVGYSPLFFYYELLVRITMYMCASTCTHVLSLLHACVLLLSATLH